MTFAVANSSVAGVSSASVDVIEGRQPGSTTVHLGGRVGLLPSAALEVSLTPVVASSLVARVVTGASWSVGGQPASQYSVGDVFQASV